LLCGFTALVQGAHLAQSIYDLSAYWPFTGCYIINWDSKGELGL
jgi:hypothetical protein